jgi:predicted SAM-dependent methyltransferase
MKRALITAISNFLARSNRNNRIAILKDSITKVNIGCGLSVAPGWLNVDASLNAWIASKPRWMHRLSYKFSGANRFYSESVYCETLANNRFIFHDIKFGLPFRDQAVDFIFSSHFLEHLDKRRGRKLLAECRRVLKESGVLRIGVPDLEYAWELYRRGEKELMLHDFFFTGTDTDFSQHRSAYDFELLSKVLAEVGFREIRRVAFRQGVTPDIELLDNRPEYTLFVEAKP